MSDIRFAVRLLIRSPGFAIAAVLSLALGIGANTAVFSVVNALLIEPLPFRDSERLVWVINRDTPGLSGRTSTVATYEALSEMSSFEDITTYEAFFARSSYKLSGDGEPDRVVGVMVPEDFFRFLGVVPKLGRTFTDEECRLNGPGAALLSQRLWERRYSADPGVIGRQLMVNDRAATIVGVMPAWFDFGAVFAPGVNVEVYMPVVLDIVRNWGNTMAIMGRLKPGVRLASAQAEANSIVERQQRERPEFGGPRSYGAILKPFRESITAGIRTPMLILWTAVGLVLLIVCVNLSNLLLSRASTRRKEMALRGALGAGWGRLARQLLTEMSLLSLIGGGLGVGFAYAIVVYIRRFEGLSIPLLQNVEVDARVLAMAAGLSAATLLLLGLTPLLAAGRSDLVTALKEGSRGSSEGREYRLTRSSLVIAEVALASLLLVGAGLLIRSFGHVRGVDLGFRPGGTFALRVDPGERIDTQDEDERNRSYRSYMRRLMEAARSVPGIEAASISDALPFESNRTWGVRAKGEPTDPYHGALVKIIGPDLMKTMGTPIITGREFTERDDAESPRVVLINETLALQLWPNQDPLLQVLRVGRRECQVVGVVADVRHLRVEESSGPEFYLPILQWNTMSPSLVIRTSRPFADVSPTLRNALAKFSPNLPTAGFRPLQENVDRAVSKRRFFTNLLTAFAVAALSLAAIGIYGVISYSVTRRTAEIGIRMALGSSVGLIRARVVGDALRLSLLGAAIGLAGAIAVSSILASLLFGISPIDPWTYVAAAGILLFVAVTAAFIPALRASRISPMSALRTE